MRIESYPTVENPPDIVPARPQRGWMERFAGRHPYKCLPLTMANTTGWEALCPVGFEAEWNGGREASDITVKADHAIQGFDDFVRSHFTHGVLTFHLGQMFRTPPGWSMWAMGPPNHIKDGIQPLVGLIETDWLPYPFTMNWHFTRPGKVRFEKGEPFCFLTLTQDREFAQFEMVKRQMNDNPELRGQYDAWYKQREEFNNMLRIKDEETVREAWQRFYFRGELPEGMGKAPEGHTNKRRMKPMKPG